MKSYFLNIYNKFDSIFTPAIDLLRAYYIADKLPLGEFLVKGKIITITQLQKSLEQLKDKQKNICQIIVDSGYVTEEALLHAINSYYRISATTVTGNIEELINNRNLSFKEKLSHLRIPLWVKLSIAITSIICLTILTLGFVILVRQKEQLYQQTLQTGKVSLNYFINNARIPLINDDILRLNALIKEASSVEGLVYAVITDTDKEIKAHTDHTKIGSNMQAFDNVKKMIKEGDTVYFIYTLSSGARVLNLSRPVSFKQKKLGEVHVGVSLDFINNQTRKEGIFILGISLVIVMLGIAISVLLGISFSRPISKLVLATQEIGKGNFQYRIEQIRKDEFGDLSASFNYMSQELWKKMLMQKSFGRYVSPEVLDMILANPEEYWLKGTLSEATVLFTDVRGFTAYSESKRPEDIVENLNEYFRIVTRFILEYGGYVDKFIGDAVFAVFCVPIYQSDHAERAIRAAVTMQKELQSADINRNPLLSRIGISINSGMVVSGNFGSQVKMEYTVIGDNVNVASRLNDIAGPGDIIITRSTYEMIKDMVFVEDLPTQKLKGKTGSIEVFLVIDIK